MSYDMETGLIAAPNTWTYDLKRPFTDFFTSLKMTLKCEPSQYGGFLVSLHAHSKTALLFSGVKRSGEMLGALLLWAPSQKGWKRKTCTYVKAIPAIPVCSVHHRRNFQGRRTLSHHQSKTGRSEWDNPHLLLTVSTCAPGVAFLRRNLHPIGQSSSRDTLGGLQAGLNLKVPSWLMNMCTIRQQTCIWYFGPQGSALEQQESKHRPSDKVWI